MAYRLAGLERGVVINTLDDWLNAEKELAWLYIESIRGKGASTSVTKRGEYDRVTLDQVPSAEFLLDDVIDTYSSYGQRLQLRAVFKDDDGKDDWEHSQTKRLNLVAEPVGTRTGSQGPDAATERLSQSLAQGFDTLVSRNEEAQQRTLDVLQSNGETVERYMEKMLTLQAEGANTATAQAIALAQIEGKYELERFKLELVLADQETSIATILVESMPAILQSPLIANLSDLLGSLARSFTGDNPAIGPAPGTPDLPAGEGPAAPEEPPTPPA
jgi:hypothetical protein